MRRSTKAFGAPHDWSHAGRIGNWVTVSGKADWSLDCASGDRLRLRLINVANARVFSLRFQGLVGWIVALDGQPLASPEPADRVVLGPAQRADVIVDVEAAAGDVATLLFETRDGSRTIARFPVTGSSRADRRAPPAPLPANPLTTLGPEKDWRRLTLVMEGGAMGGLRAGELDGRRMSARELFGAGRFWTFNGVAGLPDEPLVQAAPGETIAISLVNDTAWPHAMHLHGHHFRELGDDGTVGPWRDTTLVGPRSRRDIAFAADNPGRWLLHCHMLEHSVSGMITWIEVAGA